MMKIFGSMTNSLFLNDDKLESLTANEDLYTGGDAPRVIVRFIAEKAGLTAGP